MAGRPAPTPTIAAVRFSGFQPSPTGARRQARTRPVLCADAHTGVKPASRRGDVVITADGERYASDAFPEVTTDRELVHN